MILWSLTSFLKGQRVFREFLNFTLNIVGLSTLVIIFSNTLFMKSFYKKSNKNTFEMLYSIKINMRLNDFFFFCL